MRYESNIFFSSKTKFFDICLCHNYFIDTIFINDLRTVQQKHNNDVFPYHNNTVICFYALVHNSKTQIKNQFGTKTSWFKILSDTQDYIISNRDTLAWNKSNTKYSKSLGY